MITKEIPSAVRESFGKGPMRRLRAVGKTPGVVYSGGAEALALEFETKVLFNELLDLQGRNAVITLKLDDGSEKNVIVKEIQTDPLKDTLYHADFQEIDIKKVSQFTVPVAFTGKAKGEDLGGIVNIARRSLVLEGQPLDIPDELAVDVSNLAIGDKITAAEVGLPKGVALLSNPELVCVSVAAP
jgi:large subunit ribosomal protein L25